LKQDFKNYFDQQFDWEHDTIWKKPLKLLWYDLIDIRIKLNKCTTCHCFVNLGDDAGCLTYS